jgi:CheY-like chemotaxis protein
MPELILMDIRMPRMDGLTATRKIREMPGGDHPRIVTVSASVFDIDQESARETGTDCFIRKPVTEAELFHTVARLLNMQLTEGGTQRGAATENMQLLKLGDVALTKLRSATSRLSRNDLLSVLDELEKDGKDVGELKTLANRFAFKELEAKLSVAEVYSKR